ncbi:MAG: ABC transporter ATP-binding protein [Rhodocyclaceae bacterium]|nr:ABC transporter ATP-binding protein [Rhodocyclaceae bacterium]
MNAPALVFENLTLGYDRHPVVHHLKGDVAEGALLALVGPNGAGKSTLLKSIAGELRPIEGSIRRCGDVAGRFAYLPQQSAIDAGFPITVADLVAMGLWRDVGLFGGIGRTGRRRLAEALGQVGLEGFERRPIGTLSGGQLQRARFARLLLQDAPLILLDEPYTAVDAQTVGDMAMLVQRWHAEGRTVIAVLHDLEHVRQHYPEALLLARETIARGASREVLSIANLERARHLAAAFDEHAPVCHRHAEAA